MQFVFKKIKKDKLDIWRDWCELLRTKYSKEALETLVEEGVLFEAFICFEINNQWYSLGLSSVPITPTNMNRELNRKHKAMRKECLEDMSIPVEILYSFINK